MSRVGTTSRLGDARKDHASDPSVLSPIVAVMQAIKQSGLVDTEVLSVSPSCHLAALPAGR
jgi:hypothetical protein